jgi:hypothetical protein
MTPPAMAKRYVAVRYRVADDGVLKVSLVTSSDPSMRQAWWKRAALWFWYRVLRGYW